MEKIKCDVGVCSHNNSGTCFADMIYVCGATANKEKDTCCGSFLNKNNYSTLTNNINSSCNHNCDALQCKVHTCKHNSNNLCSLDVISISGGSDASLYTETLCSSFSPEK